ncbi:hypothetical protein KBC04_03950 [Candidatus Babeliales bacterium]|nr:hypothetical protein [Candidatus Babeliales bacterium]MBP9843351.1 hypothetical protein [Candidatus Babeliales bacterium]
MKKLSLILLASCTFICTSIKSMEEESTARPATPITIESLSRLLPMMLHENFIPIEECLYTIDSKLDSVIKRINNLEANLRELKAEHEVSKNLIKEILTNTDSTQNRLNPARTILIGRQCDLKYQISRINRSIEEESNDKVN